jgi:hypothetical protein
MRLKNVMQTWGDTLAQSSLKHLPQLHLRWQNQSLFVSPVSRVLRALSLGACALGLMLLLWPVASALLGWSVPTAQWQQHQLQARALADSWAEKQKQEQILQARLEKSRRAAIAHQVQIDELILAWPNSGLRLSLLNRLQSMAQQRGLHVLYLNAAQEAGQQGYEGSALKFSVRGTEWATHAYWQALNQLFQNGLWTSWACRLLPDGQFALEGQMSLLWDAQDAFTDTGVELQEHSTALASQGANPLDSAGHVLPGQSQSQMRVVGAAQPVQRDQHASANASASASAWTWIRAGTQIHLVRSGQRLGLEQSQAKFADAQGLWLSPGLGQADIQLGWEDVKP